MEDVWAVGSGSLQYTLTGLTGGTQVAMVGAPGMSQNGRPSWDKSLVSILRKFWGMQPVNWLPESHRVCRLARPPSSPGISPVS